MKIPVMLSTPDNQTLSVYYDTVAYSFYNDDGSMVSDELPTEIWKLAAEIVWRTLGQIDETEVVVTVPDASELPE